MIRRSDSHKPPPPDGFSMPIEFRRRLRRAPPARTILSGSSYEEDDMPVLSITEDEKNAVIAALHHERVHLTGEWSKAFDDTEGSAFYRDSELEQLVSAIDQTTDLRRRIEAAEDFPKGACITSADRLPTAPGSPLRRLQTSAGSTSVFRRLLCGQRCLMNSMSMAGRSK